MTRALEPDRDEVRESDATAGVRVHGLVPSGHAKEAEGQTAWAGVDVIEPLYPPDALLYLYNISDTLRQCVDAMSTNIDSHGHFFEPVIDFSSEDIREQVEAALMADGSAEVDEEEIDEKIAKWRRMAKIERIRLKSYFEGVCFESSFVGLRRATTTDKESIGWGAWEVIRNDKGVPVRFKHVPAHTIRMTNRKDMVIVEEYIPTGILESKRVKVAQKLRMFVQLEGNGNGYTYFKVLGDPRKIGTDGIDYTDGTEMPDGVEAATELLLFQTYFPGSPYGVVRWAGQIPQIKGSREAHDNTLDYLENSAIPRGMLLVADGRMNSESVTKLESFFKTLRGEAENRMVVVEAETPRDKALEQNGRVQVQWVSFRNEQREDATFSAYVSANAHGVGSSFRIPPIIRGDTKDFNRATAVAAIEYAEEQVFTPEREAFDWVVNRKILPVLGVRFWKFRSRGPRKSDPEAMSKIAESFLKHGVVMPAEMRSFAELTLGIDLTNEAADFQRIPLPAWLAGFQPPPVRSAGEPAPTIPSAAPAQPQGQPGPDTGPDEPQDEEAIARKILSLKAMLQRAQAGREAARTLQAISSDA
jgi:PBSX family phage portal protein